MAEAKSSKPAAASSEQKVEYQDVSVETVDNDSSKKELEANLKFKDDVGLHPVGEPDSETEKQPGGPPATDPNRPPFATNRPDVPIIAALATGSGQHTPPDPDTVDSDGFVRPKAAEEGNK